MSQNFIKYSKLQLFRLLIKKTNEEMTDNEADILFYLTKDKEIQEYLDMADEDVKNNNKTSL